MNIYHVRVSWELDRLRTTKEHVSLLGSMEIDKAHDVRSERARERVEAGVAIGRAETTASHARVHAAIMYVPSPGDTRRHRAFRATPRERSLSIWTESELLLLPPVPAGGVETTRHLPRASSHYHIESLPSDRPR